VGDNGHGRDTARRAAAGATSVSEVSVTVILALVAAAAAYLYVAATFGWRCARAMIGFDDTLGHDFEDEVIRACTGILSLFWPLTVLVAAFLGVGWLLARGWRSR
jgi:hypothetical protein